MKKLILSLIYRMQGKKRFHKLFYIMHNLALRGMNYGRGDDLNTSGEKFVLTYINKLRQAQSQKTIIFDVGANRGDYSVKVLEVFGDTVTLYSFEPSPGAFQVMSTRPGAHGDWRRFNIGLGNSNETRELFTNASGSALGSLYQRNLDRYAINLDRKESVVIETLDAFCATNGVRSIDFLKIDVEGHELSVLQGAQEMIRTGGINFIQFEFGGTHIDARIFFRDFFQLLSPYYKIHQVLQDGLFEIAQYEEKFEIFLTANFLAIRK